MFKVSSFGQASNRSDVSSIVGYYVINLPNQTIAADILENKENLGVFSKTRGESLLNL
jgi:hypothetical protein